MEENTSVWNLIFQVSPKCQPSDSLCSSSVAYLGEIRQGSTSRWLSQNITYDTDSLYVTAYQELILPSLLNYFFFSCMLPGLLLGKTALNQSEQNQQLWRVAVCRGRRLKEKKSDFFQNKIVCGMLFEPAKTLPCKPVPLQKVDIVTITKGEQEPGGSKDNYTGVKF